MNSKKKIFIVNNQEDEDGDNLYSGNTDINKKRKCGIYSPDHSQNKKKNVVTFPSHRLFVSHNTPAVKLK